MSSNYDVIIIGSGPAGYTAAIYTSRAFLKTLIISGKEPGGQLITTTEVENFPGFEKGIMGPELMEVMKKQAERFGAEIIQDDIKNIKIQNPNTKQIPKSKLLKEFIVEGNTKAYIGKSVIIATGASAKYLGLESEQRLRGKGVSACATCDGFFFRDKEVVVVGGGDTAMEEATFLTRFAKKVTVIHRRNEFRASPIMLKRAQDNPKINFLTNLGLVEVLGDEKVTGVMIKDLKNNGISKLAVDGVFLAIGHKPNTDFLKGFIELDEKGYIRIIQNSKFKIQNENSKLKNFHMEENKNYKFMLTAQTETSVSGVFAAGDCVDPRYRQAVVAAGMGCMAAMDAQKWLEE